MARGSTLIKLLTDLRAECRLSTQPAHNKQVRETQIGVLQRTQDWLWSDFNWPHLRVHRFVPVSAGQRYYAPPTDLDIDRIEHIQFSDGGSWYALANGIEAREYNSHNSDLDERAWPVRRWQFDENGDLELWPIPDRNGELEARDGCIRITGIRKLHPLVADGDRAELDNRLLVLFAAAELLGSQGAKDAELKLSQANKLYLRLRGGLSKKGSFQMFGIAGPESSARPGVGRYRRPTVYPG